MKIPKHHKERARDFIIIMIIIFVVFGGAILIAGWMSEDIEAKDIAICPSDERMAKFTQDGMTFWNEKDENGVSNAERMRRSNEAARKQAEEWRKQKKEDAIEREALIRAKSAKLLYDMLKDKPEPNEPIEVTLFDCVRCGGVFSSQYIFNAHNCYDTITVERELPEPNEPDLSMYESNGPGVWYYP